MESITLTYYWYIYSTTNMEIISPHVFQMIIYYHTQTRTHTIQIISQNQNKQFFKIVI